MGNKELTEKVREAIKGNNLLSVHFYSDGSGAQFCIYDPTGDHGLPCDTLISLSMESAIEVVSGGQFISPLIRSSTKAVSEKWINIKI